MSEEMKSRLLREQLNSGFITIDDGNVTGLDAEGYTIDDSGIGSTLVYSLNNFFDLTGYAMKDLTTYIQGAMFQRIGPYSYSQMEADVFLTEIIVLSTTPLNIDTDFNLTPIVDAVPGSMSSTTELQAIIQGWAGVYSQDEGAGFGRLIESQTWGAGDSTAAKRLFYHRFFKFPKVKAAGGNASYGFNWPDLGMVVPIIVDKESELEYMMRLARSLEPVY